MTAVAVLGVGGVVACTVATPTPGPSPTRPLAPPSVATETPHDSPAASAPPSPDGVTLSDLGTEIRVSSLSVELTATVLEFASTGSSVLLSAGPEAEAAPDLWRIRPGPSAEPELIWHNDARDHSLVRIGGDHDTVAFVDMPITGELAWDLWLIPDDGADPIRLDSHPGDPAVPGTAPSFAVYEGYIAWAAFDRGPDGAVSQLLYAHAPEWRPQLIAERPAAEAELWFPSLYGRSLVYSEIRYSEDRLSDERRAFLTELGPVGATPPRRLDASGRATMPLINQYGIVWKEADPGFHMLNWGRMVRYDLETGVVSRLSTRPQEYVNFPSIGERFVAWWGANASTFGVYDLERGAARQILSYAARPQRRILRPHVGGGLLVWLATEDVGGATVSEIRYAYLPGAGDDRLNPP